MGLASTTLTPNNYVLIGNNVTTITFQCQSSTPVSIAVTTASSGIATDTIGLVYDRWDGELKKTVTDMSHDAGVAYVYAKAISGTAKIVYEGA